MGVGSPDPPQFIYDEDEYQDVFLSGKLQIIYVHAIHLNYIIVIKPYLSNYFSQIRSPQPIMISMN